MHCVATTGQPLNHHIRSMGLEIEDTQLTHNEIREGVQPSFLDNSDLQATLQRAYIGHMVTFSQSVYEGRDIT